MLMRLDLGRAAPRFVVETFVALALVGVCAAHASAQPRQPAPIVYANQNSSSLADGDARSYGYGVAATNADQAPALDLRRSTTPAATASSAAQSGQESAPWLEQERVGAPYQVNGKLYVPAAEPGYSQTGIASWYGPTFHGQATASGETYDQEAMTAAHPTLPIPSLVQVTNLENGREVILRVNDRGPFVGDRVIDVSHRAAEVLGFDQTGRARVNVRYLGPAPRHVAADGVGPGGPDAAPAPTAVAAAAPAQDGPTSLLPPPTQHADAQSNDPAPIEFAPRHEQQPAPVAVSYQVPPAAQALPASGGYFVQVGAFSDADNAHRVEAAIRSAGPIASDIRQTAQGQLFRVRIGPFASPEEAASAQRTLASLGYGESILAAR
ncbi:MAG: septal ring lytic transglycosylase RlpA family protein [Pseudomonadota bacterium]